MMQERSTNVMQMSVGGDNHSASDKTNAKVLDVGPGQSCNWHLIPI